MIAVGSVCIFDTRCPCASVIRNLFKFVSVGGLASCLCHAWFSFPLMVMKQTVI